MTSTDEASKLAAIERSDGWKHIMGTTQSRRAVWELFEMFSIYQVSPTTAPGDLAFAEGKRSLALQVMSQMLTHVPELHDRMFTENRERIIRENREKAEREQQMGYDQ